MSDTIRRRFLGEDGKRRLAEAFARQALVGGDQTIARALADASAVEVYEAGTEIIVQGDADADFYLVLVGSVVVERNGRADRVRRAGQHFGEMSTIDIRVRRSATIRAWEATVVARVCERDFSAIAEAHPGLWRSIAIEIADRLRQRLEDLPPRNEKPVVFIGSSKEGLPLARAVRAGVNCAECDVVLWSDGVFNASETNIESLESTVRSADIGVLVFAPDDKATSRGETMPAPRDNVVFELGLFMGALGRRRTFVVRPKSLLKMPTDLLGMTSLTYEPESQDLTHALASACAELSAAIARLGAK